ncbi:hypothetical protein [Candidatus Poriferisodalis sp.]|uniref:hypothetical protein n=1 Tax=Candidatus Poriferisodalis sp. TaxID=3101277 RepID=UPI003AF7910E
MAAAVAFLLLALIGGCLLYLVISIARWLGGSHEPTYVVFVEDGSEVLDDPDGGELQIVPDNVIQLRLPERRSPYVAARLPG